MRRTNWLQAGILLAVLAGMVGEPLWSQQGRQRPGQPPGGRVTPVPPEETVSPPPPSISRRMLKSSYEQLQKDVAQLAELALALKEEIGQANEDVLPLSGVRKAEEIEKLAKKIQGRIKNL